MESFIIELFRFWEFHIISKIDFFKLISSNNKEKLSLWQLPANYQKLDKNLPSLEVIAPITQQVSVLSTGDVEEPPKLCQKDDKEVKEANDDTQDKGGAEERDTNLWPVEGFLNWRKVDREGETPYYFHILSKETRWDPPSAQ